jgi:hypothetical protein
VPHQGPAAHQVARSYASAPTILRNAGTHRQSIHHPTAASSTARRTQPRRRHLSTPKRVRYPHQDQTAIVHAPLFPAPISPRKPLLLFAFSQLVASARRSAPIVELTQVAEVPEPSESRYWCISMALRGFGQLCRDNPIVEIAYTLLLGSVSAAKAAALPELVQVHAPVQLVLGTVSG